MQFRTIEEERCNTPDATVASSPASSGSSTSGWWLEDGQSGSSWGTSSTVAPCCPCKEGQRCGSGDQQLDMLNKLAWQGQSVQAQQPRALAAHPWATGVLRRRVEGRSEEWIREEEVAAERVVIAAEEIAKQGAAIAERLGGRRSEERAAKHVVHHVLKRVLRLPAVAPAAAEHPC